MDGLPTGIQPFTSMIFAGDGIPTVFIAVAGRSNGLGPVMSGNTVYPVINCPPKSDSWGAHDIWSSLRMPSGMFYTNHSVSYANRSTSYLQLLIQSNFI